MMRFYYIPLLGIFLFALGWLFRKPLADHQGQNKLVGDQQGL
jgi:hypothetical protein